MIAYLVTACAIAVTPCSSIVAIHHKSEATCEQARRREAHPEQWKCLNRIPIIFKQRFQELDRSY